MPDTEQETRIREWNQSVPESINGCVHELISSIAHRQPDAYAINAWDGDFTYSQLDTLSNTLACRLVQLGVTLRSNVPLYFEKSKWTPIAQLAIIKTGSAAIALDASHPLERLRTIVNQTKPKIIISSKKNAERAALLSNADVLILDDDLLATGPTSGSLPSVSPSDIVYISFTSGTTGVPKGAQISHSNVRSSVHHQGKLLGFKKDSRVLDFAPYSFDVSWSNFFHTLCAGGCLCIQGEQDMLEDLFSAIDTTKTSLINVTPTVLRTLLAIPPSLKTVLMSGEIPYRENIARFAGQVRLLNTYGPTETTFKCAFSVLDSTAQDRPDVGRGVGFCTWIVDPNDDSKLMAIGETGELLLESPMVGQGYLGDPAKTTAAFIDNPAWLGRSGRLYKTGDLFKYKPDGKLLFVGRKDDDNQRKIRGQRVELGDVQHHCSLILGEQLPVLVDVVKPKGASDHTLTLFVRVSEGERDRIKPLLDAMRQKLPDVLPGFMIPQLMIPINEIPKASTGKTDRRKLRDMAASMSFEELLEQQYTILPRSARHQPATEIEEKLLQIWATVLGTSALNISTTDSFLGLGGDSISAMRMVAAARRENLAITFANAFRTGSLSQLAETAHITCNSTGDESLIAPFSLLSGSATEDEVRTEAARLCGIEFTHVEDVFPCTPIQEGILASTIHDASGYVLKTAYTLPESVDLERFRQAWETVLNRQPVLRTRIISLVGEGLVQVVVNSSLSQIGSAVCENPIGLGTPLCRIDTSNLEGKRIFVLELHHSIFDGWSRPLILDAVDAVYRSDTPIVPSVPYQRFVRHVLAARSEQSADFWRKQLSGVDATMFPPKASPGTKMDLEHAISDMAWPKSTTTPSTIIRGALAILIASYTNSDDVLYGATTSGRQVALPGIENMLGITAATNPVRVKINWDCILLELLEQMQTQMVEIGEHEQYGLQHIHRAVGSEEASQFQLLLVVQPRQQVEEGQSGLFRSPRTLSVHGDESTAQGVFNSYAMMIQCFYDESGVSLDINFDSACITETQCTRFTQQLEHLLRQMCSGMCNQKRIRDLTLVGPHDMQQILSWNSAPTKLASRTIMSALIENASKDPDRVAISGSIEVTYKELTTLAAAFARSLLRLGVTAGEIVPICLDKSAYFPVAMLGIMQAGAVALPMASSTSSERAGTIVTSLKPRIAITNLALFDGLLETVSIATLQEASEVVHDDQIQLPEIELSAPALCLFTSGSTGKPKGIRWSHLTLSSNAYAAAESFGLRSQSKIFQFAAYDFDVAHVETFAALSIGACLYIPTEFDRINHLTNAINESGANWLCLTPSVSELLDPVPNIRTLVFAGEKLTTETSAKWIDRVDSLFNWYGPAEASVATFTCVKGATPAGIGRSSNYGRAWLVDPRNPGLLAPIGSVGEICVEGGVLSDGYIGEDADQSAFIQSELIPGEVTKLYRTGDYGMYDEAGNIIFRGRKEDSLQKLRGQRIRIDEVEAQAQSIVNDIFEARVVVDIITPLNSDSAMLVLFVGPASSSSEADIFEILKTAFPAERLEECLSTTLPSYQIPRLYYPLVDIPIGPTGKTDRRKLRKLGSSSTLGELLKMQPNRTEARAPSTAAERWLQHLWSIVIGIDQEAISANDHFFRLGGDSISAIRLVSMARDHGLRLKLTAAMIFQFPKLCDLAMAAQPGSEAIDTDVSPFSLLPKDTCATDAREYAAGACQVLPSQIIDIFPTSSLQAGLLSMTAKNAGQYISRSILELQTNIDPDRLKAAWLATVDRLPILRTRIIDYAGDLVQVVLTTLPMYDADDVQEYLLLDESKPMGLGTELCRAALVGQQHFVLIIHHCLYDGSSLPMILDTLQAFYQQVTLPEVTPYQNFIKYLTQSDPDSNAAYWKEHLSNSELQQFPVLPSPTYTPQADQRLTHTVDLPWPRLGITPSTILRAAWARLTSQYTMSPHVVFGATVSGRQADVIGVDRVGGPTVSTVPVAVSLDANEDLQEFLQRIQQEAADMVPHEQYGLQKIQALVEDRRRSLFQSLLVVQPIAESSSLDHDSYLFKARTWAASVETQGTDPFNTYALMLVCVPSKSGLELTISYDRGVIPTAQVELLTAQFETVVRQLCSDRPTRLGDIQVASPQDLDFFWTQNMTPPDEPTSRVHDLISLQASNRPTEVAIDAWDGQFTYQEVEELSTVLARKLITLGVTPGSVVLLSLERSRWTAILQLAVLKAAGTMMLQSTSVPIERLRRILKNVPTVLAIATEERYKDVSPLLRTFTPEELVSMKAISTPRLPPVKMNSAAAILVSSGSTGEPKVILWSNTTLAANVVAMKHATGLDQDSRLFSFCSHDFDVCTIEMMATLVYGGRLCIAAQEGLHNSMGSAMRRFGSNFVVLTPSASKLLRPDEVSDLATIVFAGEALVQETVDLWQGRRIVNWYGPCECSPGTFCTVSSKWQSGAIGETDSSCSARCWLVDPSDQENLTLVARGAPGEIVLEGPACAIGYLGPGAPENRFLSSPPFLTRGHKGFAGRHGRVYRTGDLACFNSEGMLVFKGRKDSSLKIRGQLVSPNEVEHHIRRLLPLIEDLQVVVDTLSHPGSEVVHLAAYIASPSFSDGDASQTDFTTLRQDLEAVLPSFAIPNLYIPLETLPLTATGKVNRLRLRELGCAFEPPREEVQRHESPRDTAERALQSLWAQVLRLEIENISRNDNFLRIADSVQAMRMVGLAQRQGLSLTVADIFRFPLLKDMAKCMKSTGVTDIASTAPFALLDSDINAIEARRDAASILGVDASSLEDMYPCTPLQEGLLALTVKMPGSYIGLNVLTIAPGIDIARFKTAWDGVVEATSILRTRIIDCPERGLLQAVVKGATQWSPATTLDQFIREGQENPIGLGTPLARFALLRPDDGSQGQLVQFCLEMHHSIYDGTTLIMLREALEQRYLGEREVPLEPFASFIAHMLATDKEEETSFWKDQFQHLEAPSWPALPSEGYSPRPASGYTHTISDMPWRTDGCTSSTLIRAAFSLVAMKYTDSSDFVFGTIVSGRKAAVPGIERIAGPTISTIPVRVNYEAGETTIGSLLTSIQKNETDSIKFEQTGISRIRQVSEEVRQACQFQSATVIQPEEIDMSASSCFVPELEHSKADSNTFSGFNIYGLMLVCTLQRQKPNDAGGLSLQFSFDENMIDSATIAHFSRQFEKTLRQLNELDLISKVSEVDVVPLNELEQIREWNQELVPASQTAVHAMITEVALRQPDDLAISAWDGDLTYSQLDHLSTGIAHRLIELGVVRNTVVPLCFEKSKFNTVACLSVMKAGGAVLMLDCSQPEARLKSILQQVEPMVILSSSVNEALCARLFSKVVVLGDLYSYTHVKAAILPRVEPSDLLFVIPTSGSTGVPKLCMLSHSNFCTASEQQSHILQLGKTSRFYDFSSYAFDAAHFTMVHCLTNGGTLCVPSEEERRDRLTESIRDFQSTEIFLTPTTARIIDPSLIPTMRNVYFGGEQVSRDDLVPWVSSTTTCHVVYGPCECTAWATSWKVPNPVPRTISLGRAVGQTAWVVDRSGNRLSGVGHIGELFLEGSLVGLGYYGDPERTAGSFLNSPEWLQSGGPGNQGRLGQVYRTGDLVRLRSNGTLDFIGRKDLQTKIRGQRIELSAVEHHVRTILSEHFTIIDLVAEVITPKVTQRPVLVAFLQVDETQQAALEKFMDDLNFKLEQQVPGYMVPGSYLLVPDIPQTAGGKANRKALRELGANLSLEQLKRQDVPTSKTSPLTHSEMMLQGLWSQVLRMASDDITSSSSFIRLSGDSISAMQLSALARRKGYSLSVVDILKAPVLSEMARAMKTVEVDTSSSDNIPKPFALLKDPSRSKSSIREAADLCNVSEATIEDIYPTTAVQQGLLAVTSQRPGDYVARIALELRDDVDLSRLKEAWEVVSKEYAPILRNRVIHIDGEGLVQVQITEPLSWSYYKSVEEVLADDASRLMGLAQRLTRMAILEDAQSKKTSCILTQSHAVHDGASLNLLLDQVATVYAGGHELSGVRSPPFQAFIAQITNLDREISAQFWTEQFLDCEATPFPSLPSPDHHPRADCAVQASFRDIRWPEDATPSAALRCAWAILTARYTDANDVVFGALVTGRQAPVSGIDQMIAPLIAALPIRIRCDPNSTVEELLKSIQLQAIQMIPYEHSDMSAVRDISGTMLQYNTLLVIQPPRRVQDESTKAESLFARRSELQSSLSGLDTFNPHALMVLCQLKGPNHIDLEFSFDSNVIDAAQVKRMAAQLETILRQISSQGTRRVGDIEAISSQDIRQLWNWNAEVEPQVNECIHQMITTTAQRDPNAAAICAWDGDLTYEELEHYSNRLASKLMTCGAGPGHVIPLCFSKSVWMPVSALAVFKAGSAAVSMDASQPEGRLRAIVEQLHPSILISSICHEDLARRLSTTAQVITVSRESDWNASIPSVLWPKVSPLDVLYIVFTSGSTGTPKGIVTTHANFASAAIHQDDALRVKKGTRVFDWVSLSFDVQWSNLLHTLIHGATLCIPSEHERRNDIAASLNRMQADYVYFTPSVAASLDPSTMPGIKTLAMGGEPIRSAEIARWKQTEAVIGIYGPAENAQALSIVDLTPSSRNGHVGHSFGGRTWLVIPGCPDRLAAIGTVGELMIEGPSVAREYFEAKDKTDAAFIHDPPWLLQGAPDHPGRRGRLYKTGDLLKQNSDGTLDFVGRKDALVKLRGQRIELTEVEFHVAQFLPLGIGAAAEIIIPAGTESPLLAIFVVTRPEHLGATIEGVEERLAEIVPRYMVPGAWIPVDAIPMTTTSKTDRRALREIGSRYTLESIASFQSAGGSISRPPESSMEKRMAALWSNVLGIDISSISRGSSFMRIGGESIAAMQLVAAARRQNIRITVADVFSNAKLENLALVAREIGHVEEEHIRHQPFSLLRHPHLKEFLEECVQHLLLHDIDQKLENVLPATDFQKQAIEDALQDPPSRWPHWILDLPSNVDFQRLRHACAKLVQHFEILRTVFVSLDDQYWQVVLSELSPPFDLIETEEGQSVDAVKSACEQDLLRPRNLGASFVRFMAVKCSDGQHKLIFRLSHAQFDGFSFGLVLQTLSQFYTTTDSLPSPPSFADVMSFNSSRKQETYKYWSAKLDGSKYPGWSATSSSATKSGYSTTDRLLISKKIAPMPTISQCGDISPATIFHAACALAFSQHFGQRDVVFGRLVTGRSMLPSSLQHTVGPLLTEVPIRHTVRPDDTLLEIAQDMQARFIEDSKHEAAGMVEIIHRATNWQEEDFGWRTAFQQEQEDSFTFLESPSKVSFFERDVLPRNRPEIYATPQQNGQLELEFEGNLQLISRATADAVLGRLQKILADFGKCRDGVTAGQR